MLTVLGRLAEFERELIQSRTSEGRSRAKARGVRMQIARRGTVAAILLDMREEGDHHGGVDRLQRQP